MTYTIFEHAQLGHVVAQPDTPSVVPQPITPSVVPQPLKPPRKRKQSWAVEAGLGLGPQFKDKRFP